MRVRGRLRQGLGEAGGFTQLPWVVAQCREKLGFAPFPGTLNLEVHREDVQTWRLLRSQPGPSIDPPDGRFCQATCQLVSVNGRQLAAVLLPHVAGYPDAKLELLAPRRLRDELHLSDGQEVAIEPLADASPLQLSPAARALTAFVPPASHWPDVLQALPDQHYPTRLNAAVELVDVNVASGLGARVVYFRGDEVVTYASLRERMNRAGNLFAHLGVRQGDRVLLHLPDGLELIACLLGLAKIGAVAVPTYTLLRSEDLRYREADAEARVVVAHARFFDEVAKAAEHFRFATRRVVIGQPGTSGAPLEAVRTPRSASETDPPAASGWQDFQALFATASPQLEAAPTQRDDPALLLYTSGSTGTPKGCIATHADLLAVADGFGRQCLNLGPADVLAGQPPLAFSMGAGFFLSFPPRLGVPAVVCESKRPEALLRAIERHRVTTFVAVPSFYNQLIDEARRGSYDVSSLRQLRTGGEPLAPHLREKVQDYFGLPLHQVLGATETLHTIASFRWPNEPLVEGSFGRPVPGYQIAVRDSETFAERPRGVSGILTVRGPTGAKYWRKPEQQTLVVREGWTVLPDLVHMDERGYLYYEARTDEVIVTSGFNIAPVQVEEVVGRHPAVAEVAVVPAPDPEGRRAQVVHAFVVPRAGFVAAPELAEDIQAFVKANAAPYLYPRMVTFVDALPRTASGKLQRTALRKQGGATS